MKVNSCYILFLYIIYYFGISTVIKEHIWLILPVFTLIKLTDLLKEGNPLM